MSPLHIEMPDGSRFDPNQQEVPVSDAPQIERVRFSRLKLFAKSAAHYRENAPHSSSVLDRGSAVHSILLKGAKVTCFDRVTESGKAAPRSGQHWEAFKAANSGAIILSRDEYDTTNRMVDSVRANPDAMALLVGKIEDTIEFDYLGLPCRTTPDARTKEQVVELKTCRSSRPEDFAWQSKKMSYHAQMAFHTEGMASINPSLNPAPYIVAVESTAPYPVTVFKLTPAAMLDGHKRIRFWFEQLRNCLSSDIWPAYSQSVVDLDVPGLDEVIFEDAVES